MEVIPEYLAIGTRLIELRGARGLNQKRAAAELDIKARTYQNYEYGFRRPNTENLNKIINYYGCSYQWLISGEGVPYPDQPVTPSDAAKPDRTAATDQDVDMTCLRLSMDATRIYQEKMQTAFSADKSANLSYALYKILIDQSREWQTEKGVSQILESLLRVEQYYEFFRKLNMDVHATPAFLRFITDPERKLDIKPLTEEELKELSF